MLDSYQYTNGEFQKHPVIEELRDAGIERPTN
jgi:hypothetical protein